MSLQRRTNGLPGLEDLLANKNGGGDQLLALLCTANTVAAKLRAGNAAREQDKLSPRPTEPEHGQKAITTTATAAEEPTSPETINTWELMADLEREEEEEEEEEEERSQRQQPPLLQDTQELAHSSSLKAGESVPRSRSFRTVEDFDAMVTGNSSPLVETWLEDSHGIPSKDHPPHPSEQVQVADASGEQENEDEERTRGGDAHHTPDGPEGSDSSAIKVEPELPDVDSVVFSRSSSTSEPASAEETALAGARSFAEQKGLRRRAMARELKSLKVPSFEFSSVGSLREWLGGGGQVSSPGSYVTPKFGSFGSQAAAAAARGGGGAGEEEALFDPQLVADLEEAMERLTVEEEHILRQIVDSPQGSQEEEAAGYIQT